MCGTIGFLGKDNFVEYIMNGLYMLQNRGYDSVGIAYIEDTLKIIKKASKNTNNSLSIVNELVKDYKPSSGTAIGHTRWATHGGKTDENAHPHTGHLNEIALVHNGTITNFDVLKSMLLEKGYTFESETDTEVISILISMHKLVMPMIDAIKATISMLQGTWALIIIDANCPNKMWATRNGSPLNIGYTESLAMICSEASGFGNYITQYAPIDNHCIAEITFENNKIHINMEIPDTQMLQINTEQIKLSPEPYPYWMINEIHSQPECVKNAINNGGRLIDNSTVKLGGLEQHSNQLLKAKHLILLGCGTSFNAGLWVSHLFKSMKIFKTVQVIDGAEFMEHDIPDIDTVIILLSQSGETRDLIACFSILSSYTTIGVVNVPDSEIARQTTCGVYLNAGKEFAVASTKSFTLQCVVLTLIAVWFAQHKNICFMERTQIINDIRLLSTHISNVVKFDEKRDDIIVELAKHKSCFILGKGESMAIATESALKLKEISYIHAEGYSSSALKHGPFALIEPELPIIILDTNDIYHESNMNAFHETCTRKANVITIGNNNSNTLQISKNKTFSGVLANIHVQIISYGIALIKGINPDFPRNLAKVVTVA